MGIEIPGELQWVAQYLLGAGDWPDGDETAMRRVADGWTAMANTLDTVDDDAAVALNAALTAISEGETHTAIATFRDKFLAGDQATVTAVRTWCRKQAELLDDGANDIEHTKLVIIGTMIVTAAELALALATSWTGVGAVAGVAARVAGQIAIRIAIKQLIARMLSRGAAKAAARLALRGAAFEALEEGGVDLAARMIQVSNGDRTTDKFGWTDLGLATFGGAVGGAVGGVLGGGTGALADTAGSTVGKVAGKVVGGAVTELGADVSAQVAAAGVGAAFLGQEFNLDIGVDTFTSAGAGGVQSTLESSGSGPSQAPTVPELGTEVPGATAPAAAQAPATDPSASAPADTDPAATTAPAATTPASTTDPQTPAPTADPQATAPAAAEPAATAPPSTAGPEVTAPTASEPAAPAPAESPTAATDPSSSVPGTDSTPESTAPAQAGDQSPETTAPPAAGDQSPLASEAPASSEPNAAPPNDPPAVNGANDAPPAGDPTPTATDETVQNPAAQIPTDAEPPSPNSDVPAASPTADDSNPTTAVPATTDPAFPNNSNPADSAAPSPPSTAAPLDLPPQTSSPDATSPNPLTGQPTSPPTEPANPSTTTPATAATPSTGTPSNPGPTATPSTTTASPSTDTRPASTDTSTATTTAPPTSPASSPTTTTPPTATPTTATPPTTTPNPGPASTTLTPTAGTPASPQSTPTTPASPPNTPAAAANPPRTPTSTPTNQQDLGTSPTPPQSSNPNQTFGPNPTPTAGATTHNPTNPPPHNQARALRESLRNLPSQDGRTTAVDANRSPFTQRPPAYRLRRFHLGGNQWVAVATIRAHIPNAHLMSPAELQQAMENIQATVDATFNNGSRLLSSGDRFLVDVEFTTDPAAADTTLNPHQPPNTIANTLRDHIGLFPAPPGQALGPNDMREISNDIARAYTPTRLSDPADSRVVDHRRLADIEDAAFQQRVEDSLRSGNGFVRGADPRTHPYGQSVNDGGRTVPGRGNNCLDCSLAALSSFFGLPRVSAPRWPDLQPNGQPDNTSGEWGGRERAAAWLGSNFGSYAGMPLPDQYQALHNYIASLGPGSAAIVGTMWHARDANGNKLYNQDGSPVLRGGHATVIVFPPGAAGPVWWDPQSGETFDAPPASLTDNAATMECIPLDANGEPPHAGTGTHQGTGQTFAGPSFRTEPGVQHPGGQTRLGMPADGDPGGTGPVGNGPGQLRDQQTYGSDHGTLEHGDAGDRGGIRPDNGSGPTTTGLPGVSETATDTPDQDLRGPEHDRVPGPPDLPGNTERPGNHPGSRDHQESDPAPSDGPSLGSRDIVGVDAEPDNGDMARGRDDRGVADTTTTPTNSTPQTAAPPLAAPVTTPTPVPAPTTPDQPDPGHSPDARPLRDSLRNLPSQDGRTSTVDTNRNSSSSRPPAYRTRRFQVGGRWVTVATIRAYIPNAHLMTPAELHQEIEYAQAAIDATFNHNQELPGGDRFLVDVEFCNDPNAADLRLNTQQHRFDLANDLREHLGLPPGKPDQPLSEADLRAISNDIARANTPARFPNPADLRAFGPHELAPVEQAQFQSDVEDHLRRGNEFLVGADPRTNPYGQAVNDGGPGVRGRGNNCLDCSLSALSSFYGVPQVSAPRSNDTKPDGTPDTESGEASGLSRAAQWLGGGLLHFGGIPIAAQYQALHDHIAALGPGSSALVINSWHAQDAAGNFLYHADGSPQMRGSHATVVVYPIGASGPVWWDPQSGMTSDVPPSWMVNASLTLEFTPIDSQGGNPHAGTNSHGGTSPAGDGPMVRAESGIRDGGDAARLGQPGDPDGRGTGTGAGIGPGELHSEQTDRSDHRPPQPADGDDRRGIRPGDRSGPSDTGQPGVPAVASDQHPTDVRGPEHSAVRDAGDSSRPAGQPTDLPDPDNHQEPVHLSPHRQSGELDGGLGGGDVASDGVVADGGHLRAVTEQSGETPGTSTDSQTAAPQPAPVATSTAAPGALPNSTAGSNGPVPASAPTAPTPQQVHNASRSRAARDNLRTRQADGGVRPVTDHSGRRGFTWARHTAALAAPVSVLRIGIHLSGAANLDPAAVSALLDRAQLAADLHFNGGFQLPNGDWVMVDLVPVANPADADLHMHVDSSGAPGTTQPNVDLPGLTSRLREQLGLDPNTDRVSVEDLQQLGAAVDRAAFTPPAPPWLSATSAEPGSPRTTSVPQTRHDTGHPPHGHVGQPPVSAQPDFRAPQSIPPPRSPATQHGASSWDTRSANPPTPPSRFGSHDTPQGGRSPADPRDFRAPESIPPPRLTIPTSTPSHAPRPADSNPRSAPLPPHDPRSWGVPNPHHPSRNGGRRPLWRRILGLPPREPASSAPVAPSTPHATPPAPTNPAEFRPPIAAPSAPQSPADEFGTGPYRQGPPFQTQNMNSTYDGEHIPGNSVWLTPPSNVRYLDENERQAFRLEIRNGQLYAANGRPFDTRGGQSVWHGGGRAIFVMDQDGNLYASLRHSPGIFHHSSFLAGAPVAAAGELVVIGGVLQQLTDSSGHYRPERGHTVQAIEHLRSLGVALSAAQVELEAPR
ncbi:toxin glutamine deamidase domain-containing protein [Nocardia neocaledoniensis]|uniref:toxin glutamine deamidase domain-containing protein n=2 Tax=Nocardia neocaledoniensis TaxID=236511 RepID=UPI0033CB9FD6